MTAINYLIWFSLLGGALAYDDLIIYTESGPVRGIKERSVTNKTVDSWYGIPFAQPPVGNLRYKHPREVKPWNSTFDATQLPNSCWQVHDTFFGQFEGSTMWNANSPMSEDCLTLSVIVPRPRDRKRAVMVWIYGGCFFSGTTTLDIYDYKTLAAEQDIIVVAIQYRLGNLGFLYLDSDDAPGNAGLYDQVMALRWIKDNIESFGGIKENVTLFGESAGATSIAMFLLSPITRNLFSQVILQSGAAAVPWGLMSKEDSVQRGLQMAKKVDCPYSRNELAKTLYCLKQANASDLVKNEPTQNVAQFPFVPIIDGSLLNEPPIKSLLTKNFKKTNIMLGSNTEEGFWFILYYLDRLLPRKENVKVSRSELKEAIQTLFPKYTHLERQAIIHEYTDWLNPGNDDANLDAIDKILGDSHFTCNVNEMAYQYALAGSTVYMYYFTHRSSQSKWPEWTGVLHGDEIAYIFGIPLNPAFNYTSHEQNLSRKIMRYWANFAKTGTPMQGNDGRVTLADWPPYTAQGKQYLTLNANHTSTSRGPRLKQCAFWKSFMPKLQNYSDYSEKKQRELCSRGFIARISWNVAISAFALQLLFASSLLGQFH